MGKAETAIPAYILVVFFILLAALAIYLLARSAQGGGNEFLSIIDWSSKVGKCWREHGMWGLPRSWIGAC